MYVRLTRKLADTLDGVDVSRFSAGDLIDLAPDEAEMLIAEGWAEGVSDATARAQPRQPNPQERTG